MRKARFKETEIVRVLKEVEAGRPVKEVYREYGISGGYRLPLLQAPSPRHR